jgi:integrase
MPRSYDMTWQDQHRRWQKRYHGTLFVVSCRQLREQGYDLLSDTKEGSYLAANLWWARKEQELRDAAKPPPRPLTEVEKLVFAAKCIDPDQMESTAREMDAAGATPEEIGRFFADWVKRHVVHQEPLTPCLKDNLPPARVQQLETAVAAIHGSAPVTDLSVTTWVNRFLEHKRAQVEAGQLAAARVANCRTYLNHFQEFFGPATRLDQIDANRLDAFYRYLLGKIRKTKSLPGWSAFYAKTIFMVSREFLRFGCKRCKIAPPDNLNDRFKFGSVAKTIHRWTSIEFLTVLDRTPGKLKLCLLLMANCGMTQQDVSDLLDEEVDWERGYITRKRSKTKDREHVPTVSYKLWPSTFALLQRYRSGSEHVLLTEAGQPYVRTTLKADGKLSRADGFVSSFAHVKKRLGFTKPLKQIRKLSASLLAQHEIYGRFDSFFLGHSPRTVADRHYVTPPQDLFDKAVLWLGRKLGQVLPETSPA